MSDNLRTDLRIIWAVAAKDIGDALKNRVIWVSCLSPAEES